MSGKIFFSVGEPSGDLHGANLIEAIRQRGDSWTFCGYGGPKMRRAGCDVLEDLTQLAIMGVTQVVAKIPKFWGLYRKADEFLRRERPDAVVLIDYPGFNWWIARAAKRQGIPVFYYGVPQMWAWASWRVRKMRRLVDHVLCKLPFEREWYQQRGCRATFVGHPYFDELATRSLDEGFASTLQGNGPLVTLLPGSRRKEVQDNWPILQRAAVLIQAACPDCQVAAACFSEQHADEVRASCDKEGVQLDIYHGRTPELIREATVCLACSGSVSLELLYHKKPSAIVYWGPRWRLAFVRRFLLKVRYITLVNLLGTDDGLTGRPVPFDPDAADAERVPMPEYLTSEDCSPQVARHAIEWLEDPKAHARKVEQLGRIRDEVVAQGASATAATYICDVLSDRKLDRRRAA
jgi:lipid-A-disaccharide synthase